MHFLCTPVPKIAGRFRLFALFDTPMMKLVDSLKLCAFHSRKVRNVSSFLQRHDEHFRQSQAVCTFWALHSRKSRDVSGGLRYLMKLADSLRLFALFAHSTPENCGTSQAICIFCHPHDEIGRQSQALRTPFPKKGGTSQALCSAMMKIAESLRLFALFGRSSPENWGTSQAICIVL